MASDILSYNVVQDHEGISIKGYRGYTLGGSPYLLAGGGWSWRVRPCSFLLKNRFSETIPIAIGMKFLAATSCSLIQQPSLSV